jgi:hypothetical protein
MGALIVAAACGGSPFSAITDAGSDAASSGSGSGSSSGSGGSSGSSGGSSGGGSSGGSSGSSSGGGSGGDASSDGPTTGGDGAVIGDAATCTFPPTRCGGMTCNGSGSQQGSLCCVDLTQTPMFGCASCSCGCTTQLECAVSADCGTGMVCCIKAEPCGAGPHMVASCTAVGQCTGQRLCNPGGNAVVECASAGTNCSPNTASVSIPANSGYGVCM